MFQVSTFAASPAASQDNSLGSWTQRSRPRRSQVSRACAWCRTYRVKCDAYVPCRNCVAKGRKCTSGQAKEEVRTFPDAIREIDRLKDRVKELEEKLKKLESSRTESESVKEVDIANHAQEATFSRKESLPAMPTHLDPLSELGVNKKYYNWDVVSTRSSNLHRQTYGTSSSFYFINQMTAYLEVALVDKFPDIHSSLERIPYGDIVGNTRNNILSDPAVKGCDLSRATEESYLTHFWKFSEIIAPMLNRAEFETYYNTLWDSSRALRHSSALADIMLALCMQYQAQLFIANPQHETSEVSEGATPETAGAWWYRRGQKLLVEDLEEPSIATFQCHMLSVIWLSNAGRHNTAHSVMASGIRTGIVLGLHLEPPKSLPLEQREFRKRLWWITYALEMRFAMELGRPLGLNCKQVTCSLPSEESSASESGMRPVLFAIHLIKLSLASRAVYITFYRQCAEELNKNGKESIYEDPTVLEECANFLASRIVYLRTWIRHVPSALLTQRKHGEPFSIDNLELVFESSPETPLRRQSIILELHYHVMAMSLYRVFIPFSRKCRPAMSNTGAHAVSCVKHAIAITRIMEQTCTNTNYLNGMIEVWQWQWSAALSLVGYVLAYPNSSVTAEAREFIEIAILLLKSRSKHAEAETICNLVATSDILHSKAPDSDLSVEHRNAAKQRDMQALDMSGTNELEWDFGSTANNLSGGLGILLDTNGFGYMTGSLSTLGSLDAADQSMFEFLDFEEFGNI